MMKNLTISNIAKVFLTPPGREVIALKDVRLNVEAGEFLAIIGPTGCGKTTLLRIFAGLEIPDSGEISLDEKPLADFPNACTLVFQQYSLFPWLNALDNVAFPLESKGIRKRERRRRAETLLELVGLKEEAKTKPYELSGGMQQRVAIARALACDPEILLMDEPFGALDERTRNRLQNILLDLWEKKRKTIILVTHNIDEAIYLADRIVVMAAEPGRIVEEVRVNLPRPRNRLAEDFSQLHLKLRNILELHA